MIQADRNAVVGDIAGNELIAKEDLITRARRPELDIRQGRVKGSGLIRKELTSR